MAKEKTKVQKDLFGNILDKQLNGNGRVPSGYTIYNAEQDRRTQRNDLPNLYPDFPEEKYCFTITVPSGI